MKATELNNGCKLPKTLEIFNRLEGQPHLNFKAMMFDSEGHWGPAGREFVQLGLHLNGDDLGVRIDTLTEEAVVFIEYKDEQDYQGITTLDALVDFLNSLPHINRIFIEE